MTLPDLALSVRQPWAYALIMGWKPVENRSWRKPNPGLAYRGPVAIHASSGMTQEEYRDAADFMKSVGFDCPPPDWLPRGGIVGSVTITGIVRDMDSPWFFGPVGLVVSDPAPCEPIPCAGSLGFFAWKDRRDAALAQPKKWMVEYGNPPKQPDLGQPSGRFVPADLFGGSQ
jgi:hypothetical protein